MFGNSTATNEDLNKSKRFNNWHSRQGISAPQDYPLFANQPAPFSSVPQNPNVPTAASPYIQKIMALQPAEPNNLMVRLVWDVGAPAEIGLGGGSPADCSVAMDGYRSSAIPWVLMLYQYSRRSPLYKNPEYVL